MPERITDKLVKDAEAPASGNRIIRDDLVRGFGLRITSAGAKAFILGYSSAGRERRYTIGSYPTWSVEAARKEAKELRRRVDGGADPLAEKEAVREAPDVGDLCDYYEREHLPRKRPISQRDDKAMLAKIVRPRLGRLKVATVDSDDVARLHAKLSETAPVRANRVVSLLSKMFSLAVKQKWIADNPAKGIARNPEVAWKEYVRGAELSALIAALGERTDASADVVRLLLITGARRGETLSATWQQFDLSRGTWRKPASSTKQRREHEVALSAPARKLLSDMRARASAADDADHLFPGRVEGKPQTDLKTAWHGIVRRASVILWSQQPDTPAGTIVADLSAKMGRDPRFAEVVREAGKRGVKLPAGLTALRVHDLRHSFAAMLASGGASLPLIGALLGHASPTTTARYSHLYADVQREAADRAGAAILGAGMPGADVVPIRGGRAR